MQGVRSEFRRLKSKKALKEVVATAPGCVTLEATSIFNNEFDGYLVDAPVGDYFVVGPDPYKDRRWYAQITVTPDRKFKVK